MTETSRRLILFTRPPVAGKVKTRIAAVAGEKEALRIHTYLLQHTLDVASRTHAETMIFRTEGAPLHACGINHRFAERIQCPGDLGMRMKSAIGHAFAEGKKHVVLIGSDCLQLDEEILENAFRQLLHHDLVIGPARDGGYYLIGMSRFIPGLFDGPQWSSSSVFQVTVNLAESLGIHPFVLPELPDIDTWDDWVQAGGEDRFLSVEK